MSWNVMFVDDHPRSVGRGIKAEWLDLGDAARTVAPVDSVTRRFMARGEYGFTANVLEQRQRVVDA
jgi:hypothetical protein